MAKQAAVTRKGGVARKTILDATSQIIAEKGLDGFTISDVARRADINRALIYHYFKDRDNLVVQAVDHILDRHSTAEEELEPGSVESGARMFIDNPDVARLFFQLILAGKPLRELGDRMLNAVAVMETIQKKLDPDSTFDLAFGTVVLALTQMSWACSRHEIARLLNISLAEADQRFLAFLHSVAGDRIASFVAGSSEPGGV